MTRNPQHFQIIIAGLRSFFYIYAFVLFCQTKQFLMRVKFLFSLIIFTQVNIFPQPCLQYGIDFTKQSQIDSFQIIYPNCTEIIGDVNISGSSITNLNGLEVLTTFWNDLTIESCNNLHDLDGLDNVMFVVGNLTIKKNNLLESLSGLEKLNFVGNSLNIEYTTSLESISSLHDLTYIGGNLDFKFNYVLTDFKGLDNLQFVGGIIHVFFNQSLTSLHGIDNIDAASVNSLSIYNNSSLSSCAVQSICDYLVSAAGTIDIYNNAAGCNSQAEVETACMTVSAGDVNSLDLITIYPNPAYDHIYVIPYDGVSVIELNIYNQLGQKVYSKFEPAGMIDISNLDPGIYFTQVIKNDQVIRLKLIVR